MEDIRRSKLNLVACLTHDPDFILQVVQENMLIAQREYQKLKAENDPEKRIINLLDIVIGKGNSSCESFIRALQKDNVKETYPNLIEWLSSREQVPSGADLSGRQIISANVHVSGGSFMVCPIIQTHHISSTSSVSMPVNFNSPRNNKSVGNNLPLGSTKEISVKELEDRVTDKKSFLIHNWSNLVQKVKNVDELADRMMGNGLTNEMYSKIMACKTPEEKMRKLLQYSTTTDVASGHLFIALCTLHNYIIQELTQKG
ncbi:uncharacterized protein LOC121285138 [Carcharodon carcharias]|uniref:uncharacterized protein LOC121285138 n=1 Tax=Carcharodon carcharias TaxID=13397 RepID=UPI001B7EBF31|nr:uncharacterized protein LOC121285138 [Carcharodon carcharias]XP_041057254.1 uncharacterized protein LOC121285138 [Carcharodon carcharias]